MEKLFENKTTYSEKTYMNFLQFHAKTYNLGYTIYTVFWAIMFLICIHLSFYSQEYLQGVVIILILIGFITYRIFRPKKRVEKELNSDKISDNNINTFSFFDKHFEINNNNGTFTFRYFNLHKIFETKDFFYLYANQENAFILSKDGFTHGTEEDFAGFIKKKCKFKYKAKLK